MGEKEELAVDRLGWKEEGKGVVVHGWMVGTYQDCPGATLLQPNLTRPSRV